MVEWAIWNGSDYNRTPTWINIGDTTDVTVRATFDSASKALSFDYSTNGATFLSTGVSYDLDGAEAGLAAPVNNGIGLQLVGFSNGNAGAITAGQMYYDNLSVSAIPEPSTYAALAGLGALGLAIWRRRQARVTAQA